LAPDVILASGTLGVTALQQVTGPVPIVFTLVADPVGAGFVPIRSYGCHLRDYVGILDLLAAFPFNLCDLYWNGLYWRAGRQLSFFERPYCWRIEVFSLKSGQARDDARHQLAAVVFNAVSVDACC
jgi:hypothetical protein